MAKKKAPKKGQKPYRPYSGGGDEPPPPPPKPK